MSASAKLRKPVLLTIFPAEEIRLEALKLGIKIAMTPSPPGMGKRKASRAASAESLLDLVADGVVGSGPAEPMVAASASWLKLRPLWSQTVEWGLNMMISGAFTLREAERKAKKERLNMWHNYVAPAGSSTKQSGKFTGTVSEVVSGDVLVVKDGASGAERRVTISSIRAPRAGRRDEKAEPYGTEAKEFLRSRLIGRPLTGLPGVSASTTAITPIAVQILKRGFRSAARSSRYPARSNPLHVRGPRI